MQVSHGQMWMSSRMPSPPSHCLWGTQITSICGGRSLTHLASWIGLWRSATPLRCRSACLQPICRVCKLPRTSACDHRFASGNTVWPAAAFVYAVRQTSVPSMLACTWTCTLKGRFQHRTSVSGHCAVICYREHNNSSYASSVIQALPSVSDGADCFGVI